MNPKRTPHNISFYFTHYFLNLLTLTTTNTENWGTQTKKKISKNTTNFIFFRVYKTLTLHIAITFSLLIFTTTHKKKLLTDVRKTDFLWLTFPIKQLHTITVKTASCFFFYNKFRHNTPTYLSFWLYYTTRQKTTTYNFLN